MKAEEVERRVQPHGIESQIPPLTYLSRISAFYKQFQHRVANAGLCYYHGFFSCTVFVLFGSVPGGGGT